MTPVPFGRARNDGAGTRRGRCRLRSDPGLRHGCHQRVLQPVEGHIPADRRRGRGDVQEQRNAYRVEQARAGGCDRSDWTNRRDRRDRTGDRRQLQYNHAIQSVNGDGSVNCVAFVPAGAVLASGPVVLNLGDSQTLLDAGGISITGTCTAAGRAQIAIAPTGGAYIDLSADSTSSGHYGGGTLFSPGSLTLADTSSAVQDRGSFNAASSNFFELDGTFLAWTNDVQCVVSASGIAASSPLGASAKSALSANGATLPESK